MTRIAFAVSVVAILGLTQDVVGSQASASVTLVDVPIPVYPQGCGETTQSCSLVFSFRLAERIGRAEGDVHPEVVNISPSQSRVLIVAAMRRCCDGPRAEVERGRAARCLWLWRCKIYKAPDVGEPELALRSVIWSRS